MNEERAKSLAEQSRKGQDSRDLLANPAFTTLLDDVEDAYNTIIKGLGPDESDNFSHIASKKDALRDIRLTLTTLDAQGEKADLELSGDKPKKRFGGLL